MEHRTIMLNVIQLKSQIWVQDLGLRGFARFGGFWSVGSLGGSRFSFGGMWLTLNPNPKP